MGFPRKFHKRNTHVLQYVDECLYALVCFSGSNVGRPRGLQAQRRKHHCTEADRSSQASGHGGHERLDFPGQKWTNLPIAWSNPVTGNHHVALVSLFLFIILACEFCNPCMSHNLLTLFSFLNRIIFKDLFYGVYSVCGRSVYNNGISPMFCFTALTKT